MEARRETRKLEPWNWQLKNKTGFTRGNKNKRKNSSLSIFTGALNLRTEGSGIEENESCDSLPHARAEEASRDIGS
jgi:hypothetical protein